MTAFITAAGLSCAVGVGLAPACAAMRAGVDGFTDLPYYDDLQEPIVGAPIEALGWSCSAPERAAALLTSVVEQVAGELDGVRSLAVIVACCEEERAILDLRRAQWLGRVASETLGREQAGVRVSVLQGGAAASFRALLAARELLDAGEVEVALVCAVDSLLDARSLIWLSRDRPLRSVRESDGVIPGEAAAALVLRRAPSRDRGPALALLGLGFGDEASARDARIPLRGDGLVAATRAALSEAGLQMHEVGLRMACGAGGRLEHKEHTLTLTRLLRVRLETCPLWLLAETLGQVGAAAGLVQLAWAHEAAARAYLPAGAVLTNAWSRGGARAVAIVGPTGAAR